MSAAFDRGSSGKFDPRILSRKTLSRRTGRRNCVLVLLLLLLNTLLLLLLLLLLIVIV